MEAYFGLWTASNVANYDQFVDKRFQHMSEEKRCEIRRAAATKLQVRIEKAAGEGGVKASLLCGGEVVNAVEAQVGEEREVNAPVGLTMKVLITAEDGVFRLRQTDASGLITNITITAKGDGTCQMSNEVDGVKSTSLLSREKSEA